MREGDENSSTSVSLIVESKDSDETSSHNSKETSKDVTVMTVDELADLIVARLNRLAQGATQRDQQGQAH